MHYLGRALVRESWTGPLLFSVYFSLSAGIQFGDWAEMSVTGKNWPWFGLLIDLLIKFFVWVSFFETDWAFVKKALKVQETTVPPAAANMMTAKSG